MMHRGLTMVIVLLVAVVAAGCTDDVEAVADRWTGSMDTLPSGQIVVQNGSSPIWQDEDGWRVREVLRIGGTTGPGPDVFGRIEAIEVDPAGRIWVVDEIAQEIRVFDSLGSHVRTIGREGEGPGEFTQPVSVDWSPDGSMWVVDVGNNRISRFDTAGTFLDGRPIPTGFPMWPWRGAMDEAGRFYAPVLAPPTASEAVAYTLVRHDRDLQTLDTLERPLDPVERDVIRNNGRVVGRVPLQGSLIWRLSPRGTVWATVTDRYRIFELDWSGDTLRSITRDVPPVPVTEADLEDLRSRLQPGALPSWWSRLPETKPPLTGTFFEDAGGHLWVERRTEAAQEDNLFDVFDPDGRYLGPVSLPFSLSGQPVAHGDFLSGVTLDELDIPYVVKLRIERDPSTPR